LFGKDDLIPIERIRGVYENPQGDLGDGVGYGGWRIGHYSGKNGKKRRFILTTPQQRTKNSERKMTSGKEKQDGQCQKL